MLVLMPERASREVSCPRRRKQNDVYFDRKQIKRTSANMITLLTKYFEGKYSQFDFLV